VFQTTGRNYTLTKIPVKGKFHQFWKLPGLLLIYPFFTCLYQPLLLNDIILP
jgi:hypothetical protein